MTSPNYAVERETTEGRVFTVTGGDWDSVVSGRDPIEDERIKERIAREILEASGYTVLQACDPQDALLIAERHGGPIHLLLTDVIMPRQSGRALAERLRPLRPELQVLFMSGYTNEAIVRHGVLEPGTLFIQKPFTPEGLGRKVREALDLGHGAWRAGS